MLFESAPRFRVVLAALFVAGCASLIGADEVKQQGVCTDSTECAPSYDCVQGACRNQCQSDEQCGAGARCLHTIGLSACLPSTLACEGTGCPEHTRCIAGLGCRADCAETADCAAGQICAQRLCVSEDDAPLAAAGGAGGSPAEPVGGAGGAPAEPAGGAGGSVEDACQENEARCVEGQPATCRSDRSGFLLGAPCRSDELCAAGVCVTKACEASATFCAGASLRECAPDGAASSELALCDDDHYCDARAAECQPIVCSPKLASCDGNRATVCNDDGSDFEKGGILCDEDSQTCKAGFCKDHVCEPSVARCDGQIPKSCSQDGLVETALSACQNQTCVVTQAGAACQGTCAPDQKQCSGNGVQSCSNGSYGLPTPCGGSKPFCYQGACTADPPSCQGLEASCGSQSKEGCCTSLPVPAGTYKRTANGSVSVAGYRLDKFEVSVGRFRKFVDAVVGGYRPAAGSGKHAYLNSGNGLRACDSSAYETGWDAAWNTQLPSSKAVWDGANGLLCTGANGSAADNTQTWTSAPGSNEKRPINCASWYQAYAFCIWDGGFLMSEDEWMYAAQGGSEARAYPWGATDPGKNSLLAVYACTYNSSGICTGISNVAPVGSVPAGDGRWLQSDLSGNMMEMTLDWYATLSNYGENCANLTPSDGHPTRGGSFNVGYAEGSMHVSTGFRYFRVASDARRLDVGFRCARAP